MGRPTKPIVLTDEEKGKLQEWARRPKTAQRLALRARIVLGCAEGLESRQVARQLRITDQTVCKWRSRFTSSRLEGLTDEPRPGTPRKITDEQVEAVITRTLETIPEQATHWSTRSMAQQPGYPSRQSLAFGEHSRCSPIGWKPLNCRPIRSSLKRFVTSLVFI